MLWSGRGRSIAAAVAVAALLVTTAAGLAPATAQQVPATGVTPEEEAAFSRYDANARAAAELTARVDQESLVLLAAEQELSGAEQRAAEADRHLADVRARIEAAELQLRIEQARLRSKAISAYIGGREEPTPALDELVSPGTLNETSSRAAYTEAVVEDQHSTVARVTGQRDTVRSLRDEAEEIQGRAAAERDEVARRRDEVRGRRDALEPLRQQAADRLMQDLAMVGDVIGRGQDHALRTAAGRAASDSTAARLLARQWGGALVGPAVGFLSRPVAGARFSSGFGERSDPISGALARHEGIDFAAAEGTPITAPADGVVVFTGDLGGYGNATVIDHGNGLGTLYGHQSQILVTAGQPVLRGDVIGNVGSTGKSTGAHLHLEVRLFGVPEDPRPYLAA
jgi:murein DD-endopeptidase MepM/ murein hydrolase activator NlpD